jgi:hypothetical protein
MNLSDIHANIADQDRGRVLDILNPWTGEPIGMRFTVAGPDSERQRSARVAMMDELADMAGADGRVAAKDREAARLRALAASVIGWDVSDDGEPLAFNQKNIVRVLKAATWLEEQVDAFAGDRSKYRPEGK